MPMTSMSGSTPSSSETAVASTSTVQAGAFRTNKSPDVASPNACSTRWTASSSDIRNRVMVGSVMVSRRPDSTCSMNNGMTEPRDIITLP